MRSYVFEAESVRLPEALIELLDKMANPGDALISSAQIHFLLMFNTLAKMKNRLQWEGKCHIRQLGSASSLATLSEKETASADFCIRKLCRSGMSERALSRVGSLPF